MFSGRKETVFIANTGALMAIDSATMTLNWAMAVPGPALVTSPSVVPGAFVTWAHDFEFVAVAPATGHLLGWGILGSSGFGIAATIATDGTVYTGNLDGKMYALH